MSYSPLQSASRNAGPLLVVFFFFILVAQIWDLPHDFRPNRFIAWPASDDRSCAHIPGFEHILVVLKTGATEALDRLPVHLDTTLRCVPHYVIFSDYEEQIAGQQVYDVLEDVSEDIKRSNPDFHLYNRLQEHGRESIQASELEHWATAANTAAGILDNPAWRLDKWMFMPLMEKSFRSRPEAKWYVFMEADTFIVWPNLLEWLSHIDSTKPHYLGSEAQSGDLVFGHGGSGFIVSNPAIQMVSQQRETHVEYYNEYTASQSAGDCVLGKAMKDVGVPLMQAWPNLQGEPTQDLDYGAVNLDRRLWCYGAVSYHNLVPEDIATFGEFQRKWSNNENGTVLRHGDVFQHFILPRLSKERTDWDNMSDLVVAYEEGQQIGSFRECQSACEDQQGCLQFSYLNHDCRLSSTIKLGHKAETKDGETRRSGWMIERIDAYVQNQGACEDEAWILPL